MVLKKWGIVMYKGKRAASIILEALIGILAIPGSFVLYIVVYCLVNN